MRRFLFFKSTINWYCFLSSNNIAKAQFMHSTITMFNSATINIWFWITKPFIECIAIQILKLSSTDWWKIEFHSIALYPFTQYMPHIIFFVLITWNNTQKKICVLFCGKIGFRLSLRTVHMMYHIRNFDYNYKIKSLQAINMCICVRR